MKFVYPAGNWIDWHEGVSLSGPTFYSEMGAAGPLGVFLLQNPSNVLREMAAC